MADDPAQPARPGRRGRAAGLLGLRRHPPARLLRQWLSFIRRKKRGKGGKEPNKPGE